MSAPITPRAGASSRGKRVLIVDDDAHVRGVLSRIMRAAGHEVELASDGVEALDKVTRGIDLMLLDARMPNMSGFDVLRRIRSTAHGFSLPVLMLTGAGSRPERLKAVEAGVSEFLTKPVDPLELRLRCNWLLTLKEARDALENQNEQLEHAVVERTASLELALAEAEGARRALFDAHVDTITRLVLAAEFKDRDTAAHITRIGAYCAVLAEAAGQSPSQVQLLDQASRMHDVGKIGIPDAILLKPGPLEAAERFIMQQHTVIGARMLHGSPSALLQAGELIALSHHERWDGLGYPRGLAGEEIPLGARICAIADFFDAMTSDRPYRRALSVEEVVAIMVKERGRHFDPDLLDLFLSRLDVIEEAQLATAHDGGALSAA